MIGIYDAIILARTKLHSKRPLLVSTVIVSGLLFSVLCTTLIVTNGVSNSTRYYAASASNGRYLVKSTPVIPDEVTSVSRLNVSPEIVKKLSAMQDQYIAKQKRISEQVGIPFDESHVDPIFKPNPFANKSLPESQQVMLNIDSPVYQEYVSELKQDYAKTAHNKLSDLKKIASHYGATEYYQNSQAVINYTNAQFLQQGKEDLLRYGTNTLPLNQGSSTYDFTIYGARNSNYTFIDDTLLQRFMLPESARHTDAKAIPVIITAQEAADLFGRQDLRDQPSQPTAQLKWMEAIQKLANGSTYTVCYRNQIEIARITEAIKTEQEIIQNKDNKNYTAPPLQYTLPTTPCGSLAIKQDKRTNAEKKEATQQEILASRLGTPEAPVHQLLTFQVVGIMPIAPQQDAMKNVASFMSNLLSTHYNLGAIIPTKLYNRMAVSTRHQDIMLDNVTDNGARAFATAGLGETIIAFPTAQQAHNFIEHEGCPEIAGCQKLFALETYGTNYLLVDDLSNLTNRILSGILLLVAIIAIVIIWFTVARVMSDSRRETAVYRAIGAKRVDIIIIYLLYSAEVSLYIILFTLFFGISCAAIIQMAYGPYINDLAKASYGVFDKIQNFTIIDIDTVQISILAGGIIATSIIATLPPLIRNIRRSPIDDMRNE